MTYYKPVDFSKLVGETISELDFFEEDSEEVFFHCKSGKSFRMAHHQDCCEVVFLYDIIGDSEDLIGHQILSAEMVVEDALEEYIYECGTWTFYKLATNKGYVCLRWLGESNGYYSEKVDFEELIE